MLLWPPTNIGSASHTEQLLSLWASHCAITVVFFPTLSLLVCMINNSMILDELPVASESFRTQGDHPSKKMSDFEGLRSS